MWQSPFRLRDSRKDIFRNLSRGNRLQLIIFFDVLQKRRMETVASIV